jgi:hypothetical protein
MPRIIEFKEQTVVVAKDQPQYQPLPAHVDKSSPEGKLTCCWEFSLRERIKLLFTGKVWHQVLTFNNSLQPQLLLVDKPPMQDIDTQNEIMELVSDMATYCEDKSQEFEATFDKLVSQGFEWDRGTNIFRGYGHTFIIQDNGEVEEL